MVGSAGVRPSWWVSRFVVSTPWTKKLVGSKGCRVKLWTVGIKGKVEFGLKCVVGVKVCTVKPRFAGASSGLHAEEWRDIEVCKVKPGNISRRW